MNNPSKMYLFRFDETEMFSEIRPRSMTLPGRKVHHRKMVLRKKQILLMRSFNIQGRDVNMYIFCKSPILQESNQPNIESPKKASIDSNSVPRTLMRSGSIGGQLLNLCQREISCVMSLQLSTSSSRWTSRMSQKCWFCTQAVLLVGNLT